MTLHRPETLEDALALIGGGLGVLAGGTDVYPGLRDGPPPASMVDITRIAGLRAIDKRGGHWCIGAAATWSDIIAADLPPLFDGLRRAAREIGASQIQNAGTIAGNLCNASPAADGMPPLLSLDAEVEIAGPSGSRRLALSDFVTGPRRTALGPGEIVTALLVPDAPGRGAFLKLGARRYLVISIAMVGVAIEARDGAIERARVAVGACSPVACRLPELEAALAGAGPEAVAAIVRETPLPRLAPIDDVRASATYRADAVPTLITRAVLQAMESGHVA